MSKLASESGFSAPFFKWNLGIFALFSVVWLFSDALIPALPSIGAEPFTGLTAQTAF
jgi:hypothetical protein